MRRVRLQEKRPSGGDAPKAEGDIAREYVKKAEVTLGQELSDKLRSFFNAMDADGDGSVTKEEAVKFWGTLFIGRAWCTAHTVHLPLGALLSPCAVRGAGKNFAKVNANSMFNEVDEDGNEAISWDEFHAFWQNVVAHGYPEEDVLEEVWNTPPLSLRNTPPLSLPSPCRCGTPSPLPRLFSWRRGAQPPLPPLQVDMMIEGGSWVDFNDGRTT